MARPKGAERAGDARGRPPPSYILLHRRPGSLPSAPEKFTKMSRCRPRPARNRGKVGRRRWEATGLTLGRGAPAGQAGCAPPVLGGGKEDEARSAPPALSRSRVCRQPAAGGEWGGEKARLEEGGDRRREQEEGREAGRAVRPRVGGRCALLRGGRTAASRRPGPPPWHPYPVFLPASALRQVRGARRLGSSGPREGCWQKWKGRCTRGAGTRRWRVRGRRGGTSLLRTAGLGPSPRV